MRPQASASPQSIPGAPIPGLPQQGTGTSPLWQQPPLPAQHCAPQAGLVPGTAHSCCTSPAKQASIMHRIKNQNARAWSWLPEAQEWASAKERKNTSKPITEHSATSHAMPSTAFHCKVLQYLGRDYRNIQRYNICISNVNLTHRSVHEGMFIISTPINSQMTPVFYKLVRNKSLP